MRIKYLKPTGLVWLQFIFVCLCVMESKAAAVGALREAWSTHWCVEHFSPRDFSRKSIERIKIANKLLEEGYRVQVVIHLPLSTIKTGFMERFGRDLVPHLRSKDRQRPIFRIINDFKDTAARSVRILECDKEVLDTFVDWLRKNSRATPSAVPKFMCEIEDNFDSETRDGKYFQTIFSKVSKGKVEDGSWDGGY